MSTIRVIIADDHPVLRAGIKTFLEGCSQVEIVAEATTGAEALELVERKQPDLLILDASLPDGDGVAVAESLRMAGTPVRILVLSAYDDMEYIRRFTAAGVAGYVLKDEASDFLVQAVEAAARGETGLFSHRIQMLLGQMAQMELTNTQLSPRETQVLHHLAAGKTNYGIAQALGIREKTVEKHLNAIYRKLNVRSRTEAAVMAVRENLL